jgi:hypothetical protein
MNRGLRAALVLAASLASLSSARQFSPPTATPALQDLAGVTALRAQFDADRDKLRIVLLLSPT